MAVQCLVNQSATHSYFSVHSKWFQDVARAFRYLGRCPPENAFLKLTEELSNSKQSLKMFLFKLAFN